LVSKVNTRKGKGDENKKGKGKINQRINNKSIRIRKKNSRGTYDFRKKGY